MVEPTTRSCLKKILVSSALGGASPDVAPQMTIVPPGRRALTECDQVAAPTVSRPPALWERNFLVETEGEVTSTPPPARDQVTSSVASPPVVPEPGRVAVAEQAVLGDLLSFKRFVE